MFKVIRVTGESLSPAFQEGDYVLVVTLPFLFRFLKPGDVVVVRQPDYGTLIKRVQTVDRVGGKLTVIGNHVYSVDSRAFGPLAFTALVGRVIWHIRRPMPV